MDGVQADRNHIPLVSLCYSSGVESALGELYSTHFRSLHRFATGLVGSVEEANDIVQNVFTRLASSTATPVAHVTKAYLFTAVRNGAKDYYKRKRSIPFSQVSVVSSGTEEFDAHLADDVDGPIELSEKSSDLESILRALAELTDEQREIVSLRYFSEWSTEEIATEMGKTKNAIRQLEFRALRSLHRILVKHNFAS